MAAFRSLPRHNVRSSFDAHGPSTSARTAGTFPLIYPEAAVTQRRGNQYARGADPWPTCNPLCRHHHPAKQHVGDDPESHHHRSSIGPMVLAFGIYYGRNHWGATCVTASSIERIHPKSDFWPLLRRQFITSSRPIAMRMRAVSRASVRKRLA